MMLPYAKFLHEAGYPTLAIDSGADANSGITWGWRERMAVLSAASELRRRGFEQRAALGVSEGAAEILLVQAAGASFAALVADSSYGNLEKMFRRVPSIAGLNPALRQTALWETGLLIGHPLWKISPEQAAANLGATPLLVIQNRDDKIVPLAEGEAIARAAADQGQLWVVQADGHGDAIYAAPEEYASRVLAFLGGHIVTESSERK